jgi:hypothetical protein
MRSLKFTRGEMTGSRCRRQSGITDMCARSLGSCADADADGDLTERASRADAGEEEGSRAQPWIEAATLGRAATQRLGGRRVQRHQPGAGRTSLPGSW